MISKQIFEELGYTYQYVDNKDINCEDTIIYTEKTIGVVIQFNLDSQCVVFRYKNNAKDYDTIALLMTKELIEAIYAQMKELRWTK